MKKAIFSGIFILVFSMYALYQSFGAATTVSYVAPVISNTNTAVSKKASSYTTDKVSVTTTTQNGKQIIVVNPVSSKVAQTSVQQTLTPTPTQSPVSTPTPITPAPTPTPAPVVRKGLYSDGTFTGSVADAYYGNIQVAVVVTDGKISDVQFLQHPSDRSTSIRVNNMAMPQLKSETIAAQSANVDIVSGATYSSEAFQQSLASALSQARA
jgi:uncharacterized protein with FMN-binding domain